MWPTGITVDNPSANSVSPSEDFGRFNSLAAHLMETPLLISATVGCIVSSCHTRLYCLGRFKASEVIASACIADSGFQFRNVLLLKGGYQCI